MYVAKDVKFAAMLRSRLGSKYSYVGADLLRRYGGNHIKRSGGTFAIARYMVHHTVASPGCEADCLWDHFVNRRWARYNPRTGGYHACIAPDGRVQVMIPPSRLSWGAGERYNNSTVHVALCGHYGRQQPTAEQLQTLYVWLCTCDDILGYNIWRGHRELAQTACPGDNVIDHVVKMRGRYYGSANPRPTSYP